jgi:succinyl-diaminopimelate desuccinylase
MMSQATDPVANLQTLIRCPSVTPQEGGALHALASMLAPMGFEVERMTFTEHGTPDIENLYARIGDGGPHLMFAGHTDVVPVGNEDAWTHAPFGADIVDGVMYGRGAVDMKGGIACFVAAVARYIEKHGAPAGSLSFLITGDEEGPAINGTAKLLQWAADKGERWDACILGEPTNPDTLGDMAKIGRRGSLTGVVTVIGTQGHVAYPHLADNPLRGMTQIAAALFDPPLDAGSDDFQPSNLEITTIDTGNTATNVIPARASAAFNIRFSDHWTVDSLKAEIERRIHAAAEAHGLRPDRASPVRFELEWKSPPSAVFLTRDDTLVSVVRSSIEAVTGRELELSTSGGTSDARYIKDYCPVVEFGLVGKTMHMVDECVDVADLETLTTIYERIIGDWFASRT